jgi:hypothetical protein
MVKITRQKNNNKETYYSFTLIEIKYINTIQVISLNVVLFGWLMKFTKSKDA